MVTHGNAILFCAALLLGQAAPSGDAKKPPTPSPAPPVGAAPKGPGGIVAMVGDEVITQAELDRRMERRRELLQARLSPSTFEREYKRIAYFELQNMVDDRLLLQLAKRDEKKDEGPYISEAEVDARINQLLEEERKSGSNIRTVEDLYREARENEKLSREEFRRLTREKLIINKYLWQKVLRGVDEFVPPQDLKTYYQTHIEEFRTPLKVSFHQIHIPRTRPDAEDLLVDRVQRGLKEGIDFVDLARQVEEDLLGAVRDANRLFTLSVEELKDRPEPTFDVLRRMRKGDVSDRVPTVKGSYFFKVVEVVAGEPQPFAEVQEGISKKIRESQNHAILESFLAREKKKTRIVYYYTVSEK